MEWRPGNNTIEDAGSSKPWWYPSEETPDGSKAVVKRHHWRRGEMTGLKPTNASADDGGAYGLRTRRESSPTGHHSAPPQSGHKSFYPEDDRPQRQEGSSSDFSSNSSGADSDQQPRSNDHLRESRDTPAAPVSIDPSKTGDVTMHLSLPTAYDIEDTLEQAARLRRIGHFKAAIEVYERDLDQFLESKYVMVQYAECLQEAGQISKLSELSKKLPDSQLMDSLDLNWALIKLQSEVQTSYSPRLQVLSDNASKIIERKWPRLDSTEVKLLTYCWDRFGTVTDWASLYRHFCDESMIWDFHDLFVSMASRLGPAASWLRFFPRVSGVPTSCLEQLDHDWANEGTDTSANFALLEILTTSGLEYLRVRDTKKDALECLERAGEYATRLRSQDLSNIKTRPYLRWMVAKAVIEECPHREWTLVKNHLGSFEPLVPGFLSPGAFPDQAWPIYAPFEHDGRTRLVGPNHASINKLLPTIVKAAEENGDFLLRTACLKELVLNGAEGIKDIMEQLENLWKESGHADSATQMHIYQYLLRQDPSDNDKVRHRILLDGETSTGWTYHARCKVMAALATNEGERSYYKQKAEVSYNQNYAAHARMMERSQLQERVVRRERPHSHMRGYNPEGTHRSSGGREREESSNFLRPSDDQKRNRKSPGPSVHVKMVPPPETLVSTGPLTPKSLALKEQEQNKIIRSREKGPIGRWEDDAIGTATASGGTMTDLTVAEYSSKNLVSAENEDEHAKSDETQRLQPTVEYGDPEDEDLPRRDSIDTSSDGKS